MTQPLALVFYERLLPGTQLVNRLQDLHYRVQVVAGAGSLPDVARERLPMLVLVDLQAVGADPLTAIQRIKSAPATSHIPIIAFSGDETVEGHTASREAGATLVVQDQALLNHLPQLLEKALHVE